MKARALNRRQRLLLKVIRICSGCSKRSLLKRDRVQRFLERTKRPLEWGRIVRFRVKSNLLEVSRQRVFVAIFRRHRDTFAIDSRLRKMQRKHPARCVIGNNFDVGISLLKSSHF